MGVCVCKWEKVRWSVALSIGDKAIVTATATAEYRHHLNSFHFYSMWHVLDSEWMNEWIYAFVDGVLFHCGVLYWNRNLCGKNKLHAYTVYSVNEVRFFFAYGEIQLNYVYQKSDVIFFINVCGDWPSFSFYISKHLNLWKKSIGFDSI